MTSDERLVSGSLACCSLNNDAGRPQSQCLCVGLHGKLHSQGLQCCNAFMNAGTALSDTGSRMHSEGQIGIAGGQFCEPIRNQWKRRSPPDLVRRPQEFRRPKAN